MGNRQAVAEAGHSLVGAAVRQVVEGQVISRAATLTGALLLAISPPGLCLTLGEVNVRSAIGQRLSASVPVRVADGESLVNGCVAVQNGPSGLTGLRQAEVVTPQAGRAGNYTLQLTTRAPLYEPMYELELRVACPGAPAVVRQYVLMLDLPGSRYAADLPVAAASLPEATAAGDQTARPDATSTIPESRNDLRPDSSALTSGVKYRVREGDTLSSIAARVQGRRESLWTLADRIFAANPGAFIRGDANLIRLGAEIVIPGGTGVASAVATATPPAPPAPMPQEPPATPTALPAVVTPASTGTSTTVALPVAARSPEPETAAPPPEVPVIARPAPERPAVKKTPKSKPVSAETSAPAGGPASPLAATIAGVVFGLVVSGLLWLGRNLPARKPWRAKRRVTAAPAPVAQASEAPRPAPVPIPVAAHRPLPSFTVSYSQVEDDPLAGEFAPQEAPAPPPAAAKATGTTEITSELEQLFGSTGAGIDAGKTVAARAFGTASAAKPQDAGVDILLGDDNATISAPAPASTIGDDVPDPLSNSGTIDLHSLAGSTSGRHQAQARDLMDALSLLERDYEEELTASQVLDLSAMREALAAGSAPGTPDDIDEDDTTLRQKSG